MSEHFMQDSSPTSGAPGEVPAVTEEPEPTGHRLVDEVVASLDELAQRPVSEHVAVFEAAHDRLRAALADAGDDVSA